MRHPTGASNPSDFVFSVLTDTGYAYGQSIGQGSDVVMSWPATFLEYEAACWWSFHGTEHRHTVLTRKTAPENFEVVVPPKPGSSATPSTVTVRFFAYDPSKQEIRKNDSGEYELVGLSRTE